MSDIFLTCVVVLAFVALVSWTRQSDRADKQGGPFWLVGYRKSDNQPVVFGTSPGRHDIEETLHDHLAEGDTSQYHAIELQGRDIAPQRYYPRDYAPKDSKSVAWTLVLGVLAFIVWMIATHQ